MIMRYTGYHLRLDRDALAVLIGDGSERCYKFKRISAYVRITKH